MKEFMEDTMRKVINIEDSREYNIFNFFANCRSYRELSARIRLYNKKHPKGEIFDVKRDEKGLRDCLRVFNEAQYKLKRNVEIDYQEPEVVEELTDILEKALPWVSRERMVANPKGVATKKVNVGHMLEKHVINVRKMGMKELYGKEPTHRAEPVTVDSYRRLPSGYDCNRMYAPSNYKHISEILKERIAQGK